MEVETAVNEAIAKAMGAQVPERVRARFAFEPELDKAATQEQGRPVFRQAEFVYITVPSDPHRKRFRANDKHRARFAREYHWFMDTEKAPADGMPIEEWNQITKTKAAELKWAGISTVEILAKWDLVQRPLKEDDAALVALAQQYLEQQEAKDARIAELEAEVEQLKAKLPKRGRPPKVEIDDTVDDLSDGSTRDRDKITD